MAGNFFGKVAADTLGLSDIGKIIEPRDFDKVDGDDYILHEDGEKIFFVIKSKQDEYVFTNYGLLHVDGQSAVSKKRTVKRHEFYYERVHSISLETAGTIDADVEIKFSFDSNVFSIDVDKKQLEKLKDLYKALIEVNRLQNANHKSLEDGRDALNKSYEAVTKAHIEGDVVSVIKQLTEFNSEWTKSLREQFSRRDFSDVYEKYINN